MLDLNLFRKPTFSGISYGTFAIGAGMFAMFLYITIYMQSVIGMTPLEAGVRFLPLTLFAFIVPLVTRNLAAAREHRAHRDHDPRARARQARRGGGSGRARALGALSAAGLCVTRHARTIR